MKNIPDVQLLKLEVNFHSLIRDRLLDLLGGLDVALPSIDSAVASPYERQMFEVSAMKGGFSYWFEHNGIEAWLLVESWSKAVKGSGQLHRVTIDGVHLLDDELC